MMRDWIVIIAVTLITTHASVKIIRSKFKKKKCWRRPRFACYPILRKGDVVNWHGKLYIISDDEPNIRSSRGIAGCACYTAIRQDGCIASITNWDSHRIDGDPDERKENYF